MSGRKASRRRPSAAAAVRVVERRPRHAGTRRSAPSIRPLAIQRMTEWDEWPWLAPPPGARAAGGLGRAPTACLSWLHFLLCRLQKLANPGFFSASNPSSIQSQLAGAARRSPIHGLVAPLAHVAVPLGLFIAFAELAVGLGTILGLWTRIAALGGILISFGLFLTVSFHSNPYYTGSDIVFVFAWTPLLLAGSGGVLSADGLLAHLSRKQEGFDRARSCPCHSRWSNRCAVPTCPGVARPAMANPVRRRHVPT